jgi:hypothetical protein
MLQGLMARPGEKIKRGQTPTANVENPCETTVNRLVAGSNPARGATTIFGL